MAGVVALRRAYFGPGTGPIYLDDLLCLGTETSILQCNRKTSTIGASDCDHSEDAGVACGGQWWWCGEYTFSIVCRSPLQLHAWMAPWDYWLAWEPTITSGLTTTTVLSTPSLAWMDSSEVVWSCAWMVPLVRCVTTIGPTRMPLWPAED